MPDHPRQWHADETMDTPHSRPVRIETIHEPNRYTHGQIKRARTIAVFFGRGKLVLVEGPRR
jgi:hypothetical protein